MKMQEKAPGEKKDASADFSARAISIIKAIPEGRVSTYGTVAAAAGNPRGARQVARLLHSSSKKHGMPWHRVVAAGGRIALQPGYGYELQRALLEAEGIRFTEHGTIDLDSYASTGPA